MIRVGRIRRAPLTSRRSGTSPVPSKFGLRVCMATQSGSAIRNSKTSSQLTTRSERRMAAAKRLRSVVLPACVPLAMMMFGPLTTPPPGNGPRAGQGAQRDKFIERVGGQHHLRILTATCRPVMSGIAPPKGSVRRTSSCRERRDFSTHGDGLK
jgi:hypothetical protein